MKELLEALHKDLAEISAPKKAHIAVDQIMSHYYKKADELTPQKPEKE